MTPTRRARLLTLLDLLLLAALCLLFFWRSLPFAGVDHRGFAAGDFGNQFYAFASYRAERLSQGELPLWSPHALSGHPFLADIQSGAYYPPARLTIALTQAAGFSYQALQLEGILHYPIAAFGMYFLARRLTRSRVGAWVAAVAFTFGSYLTSYPLLQLAILETVVWLPWLFLALDHAASHLAADRARRAILPVLLAGLVFGVALTAGHPQSALLVGYAGLAFAVFRAFQMARARAWPAVLGRLAALVAFLPLGAALAAAQLLPALEYMRLSTRAGLTIDAAGSGFMPYDLIQFIFPQIATPVAALYIGVLALGLAIFALFGAARRDPALALPRDLVGFFGGLAGAGLLLSFGNITPVYQLAYLALPGWRLFRGQERLAVWVVFGLAMLAGFGAAALARSLTSKPDGSNTRPGLGLARGFWIAAMSALVFAAACFIGYQAGNEGLWGFTAAAMWLSLMLAAAGGAVWSGRPALMILVIVIDLFTVVSGQHAGTAASAQPFPPGPIFDAVRADTGVFRTANEGPLTEHIGYGYGFDEITGASPLKLTAYDRLLREAPRPLLWRLLGVKYVFTWRPELEEPAERLAEQTGGDGNPIYVYRLNDPRPRAWLNGRFSVEPSADGQLARVLAPGFDPQADVILSAPPDPAPDPNCAGTVEWTRRTPEFLALEVTTDAPCVLTLSEIAYPGWQAAIDDAPAPILTADAVLRAVAMPAGTHTVTLAFRPRPTGLIISLVALLAVAVGLLAALILESRAAARKPEPELRAPA